MYEIKLNFQLKLHNLWYAIENLWHYSLYIFVGGFRKHSMKTPRKKTVTRRFSWPHIAFAADKRHLHEDYSPIPIFRKDEGF